MSDWQPIETAPREPLNEALYGPQILLWVDGDIGIDFWDYEFDKFYVEHPQRHRGEPTHWMPIPADPPA